MQKYRVTIYNQHAGCGIWAEGRTRPEAFRKALIRAGEPWLREGGDKLTMLRVLFYDRLMKHHRTRSHCYASDPFGAGVEFRKVEEQF